MSMRPAARRGDTLWHKDGPDGALAEGSGDVEIEGRPAIRATQDLANCRHPGESIKSGCEQVTVNGQFIVGEGDATTQSGTVKTSQVSVQIGGAPVAAVECMCATPSAEDDWGEDAYKLLADNKAVFCQLLSGATTEEKLAGMAALGGILDETHHRDWVDGIEDFSAKALDLRGEAQDGAPAFTPALQGMMAIETVAEAVGSNSFYYGVGYGNIQVDTARDLVLANLDQFDTDSGVFEGLDATSRNKQLNIAVARHLSTIEGTAQVAKLYMTKAQADFTTAGINLSAYSFSEQAAILMTYYKQGEKFVDTWQDALDEGRMPLAGEGCVLCHNFEHVLNLLAEKGGCPAASSLLAER